MLRSRTAWLPVAICVWLLTACGEPATETNAPAVGVDPDIALSHNLAVRFERIDVDLDANGPAFAAVGDMDGDGDSDLVVTSLGHSNGTSIEGSGISIYYQNGGIYGWLKETLPTSGQGLFWPNDINLADVDQDGDLDILIGAGFFVCDFFESGSCGALFWLEQNGGSWVRHDLAAPGSSRFYHRAILADLDGDGVSDLVTVGEDSPSVGTPRATAMWLRGDLMRVTRFEETPREIGSGMGSLPVVRDVDGDGDLDIASAEYFATLGATYAWFEQVRAPSALEPAGAWLRHVIDDTRGPATELDLIDNFIGDGATYAVGSNHVNPAAHPEDPAATITAYRVPEDPTSKWKGHDISSHIYSDAGLPTAPKHAPGIFGHGDVDGDGDVDLVVSGDGDPRVFILEQTQPGQFATLTLEADLGQAGGQIIQDLDGDGVAELLVSGYDDDTIAIYTRSPFGDRPMGIAVARESSVLGDPTSSDPNPAVTNEPATPGEDPVEPATIEPTTLMVQLDYAGAETGDVVVAAFTSLPAAGPPLKFVTETVSSFPVEISLEGLTISTCQVMVFLDLEPLGIMFPSDTDPIAESAPIDLTSTQMVELELVKP